MNPLVYALVIVVVLAGGLVWGYFSL